MNPEEQQLRTGVNKLMNTAQRSQFIFLYYKDDNNSNNNNDSYSLRGSIHRKVTRDNIIFLSVRWDAAQGQRLATTKPAQEINAESFALSLLGPKFNDPTQGNEATVRKLTLSNKSDGSRAVVYFEESNSNNHGQEDGNNNTNLSASKAAAASSTTTNTQKTSSTVVIDEQRLQEEIKERNEREKREKEERQYRNPHDRAHYSNSADQRQNLVSLTKDGGRTECGRVHRKALHMYRSKLDFIENLLTGGEKEENEQEQEDTPPPLTSSDSNNNNRENNPDFFLNEALRVPLKSSDIFILNKDLEKQQQEGTNNNNNSKTNTNNHNHHHHPRYHRYLRGPKIGEGTFGHVFVAKDLRTNTAVAVKVLRQADHENQGGLHNMIMREMTVARVAANPLLIPFNDIIFCGDGNIFFVMPLVHHDVVFLIRKGMFANGVMNNNQSHNNNSLTSSSLPDIRTPRMDMVRTVFGQLIEVLDELHRVHRVSHRDIKPSNILLRSDGILQLGDFGWSRLMAAQGGRQTGPPCGLNYRPFSLLMCPHSSYSGEKLDMYGAGCVFYELLTSGCSNNSADKRNLSNAGGGSSNGILFQGRTESEVAMSILGLLGTPPTSLVKQWDPKLRVNEGHPHLLPRLLSQHHINDNKARQLLTELLDYDENKRPTAAAVLESEFFLGYQRVMPGLKKYYYARSQQQQQSSGDNDQTFNKSLSSLIPFSIRQLSKLLPQNSVSNYWEYKQRERKAEVELDRLQKELNAVRRSGSESVGT